MRASQGSSQASTTPRLFAQSRCQRRVLTCPVTPSVSALGCREVDFIEKHGQNSKLVYFCLKSGSITPIHPYGTPCERRRIPLPPALVHDFLMLGLASSDNETLRQTACFVLCYCWFNRADTGVLLRRSHVSFDSRGIVINAQGKTIAKNEDYSMYSTFLTASPG
jgi:hypothetical protein